VWLPALLLLACAPALVVGCGNEDAGVIVPLAADFPGENLGKFDVFGRELAGVAVPYVADLTLPGQEAQLKSDMRLRRQTAWAIASRVVDPVPLLGLAERQEDGQDVALPEGEIPTVPRWQTWYGADDFKRMFRQAFEQLDPLDRLARVPFSEELLDEVEQWNATALDRSRRWPLERFLKHVRELGLCPDDVTDEECARALQSNFSGATGGNSRIAYSPGTMRHVLTNYGSLLECLGTASALTMDAQPDAPDSNFSYCLSSEFPADAVVIKAHWVRADFDRGMPAFDTDGASLERVIGSDKIADWADGDREVSPAPDRIFTIRLRNGDTYRLAGLHIMTKELRHWVWITLWWSDEPDSDFGADRPASFEALGPAWRNYKMAVVVDYTEGDADPAARFADQPSLANALKATASDEPDGPTWSSNPYIEHGRGNARTNCIGCHQHGGSEVGPDLDGDGVPDAFDLDQVISDDGLYPDTGRTQIRSVFPADYLWSTTRVDDLSNVIRSEIERAAILDKDDPDVRAAGILALTGDPEAGQLLFGEKCASCHGKDGLGTSAAPSLYERVPKLTDIELARTLVTGKSPMPSWAQLTDQQLCNLRAFARTKFDGGDK
jgi:mono/diheme cytochrome c family protein